MQALKVWSPLVISFSDFPDGRAAFWLSNPRPRQCNEVKAMFTTATVLPLPTISSFNEFSWSPCTLVSPLLPFFPPLLPLPPLVEISLNIFSTSMNTWRNGLLVEIGFDEVFVKPPWDEFKTARMKLHIKSCSRNILTFEYSKFCTLMIRYNLS